MNLSSARAIKTEEQNIYTNPYGTSEISNENTVIDGGFVQENPLTIQGMFIRRMNKALGFCITVAICVTFVSYYTALNCEARLNKLDSEIVRLNAENQDLQSELDRYKSFNNVDSQVEEFNLLQKADKVLEITALNAADTKTLVKHGTPVRNDFNWAIGY